MSHSPLLHTAELPPPPEVQAGVDQSFAAIRQFAADFDPTLVVVFAPDHYNGFFQDMMPPFCVGTKATACGDYDTAAGPLSVNESAALAMIEFVQKAGVDLAFSRHMIVDHGMVQPLDTLFSSLTAKPMVPIFVNGVAPPWVPMKQIRLFGQAVGSYLNTLDERILVVASGGLSHDPPLPRWYETDDGGRNFLLQGRNPTEEFRQARQQRVIKGAAAFAKGELPIIDLNPQWDTQFMDDCASGQPERFDGYQIDEMTKQAGNSVHEVRTWVGAFSALSQAGSFDVTYRFYHPIREFIAGFGVMAARTKD
jgi:2,3-dihydroxyphenylpropionate 1,2-dioxygenase